MRTSVEEVAEDQAALNAGLIEKTRRRIARLEIQLGQEKASLELYEMRQSILDAIAGGE